MAKNLLQNLLDKSSSGNSSWQDMAQMYASSSAKGGNRFRNLMGLNVIVGLSESKMKANAIQNLKESERQKVFDQAKVAQTYAAYDKLMTTDEAYKKDKNHFMLKGEAEFSRLNPNFDLSLQSARDKRNQEIKDWAANEETNHLQNINNPAFKGLTKRMTKEEFYKPYEDYYVSKQQAIAAPKELSLVHKGWDMLTGKNNKAPSAAQLETERNTALQGSFGYLLNPTEVTGDAAIELYRDPNAFSLTKTEAQSRIVETVKDPDLQRSLIRGLEAKDSYTPNELKAAMIVGSTNFDPLIEKYTQAQNTFEVLWKKDNKGVIPEAGTENYISYTLQKTNFVEERTGTGDADTIELRKKIYELENMKKKGVNEKDPVRKALEAQIKLAGIDKVTLTLFNTVVAELSDPISSAYLVKENIKPEEYARTKLNEFLNMYESIF